jgi:hypothetical protein
VVFLYNETTAGFKKVHTPPPSLITKEDPSTHQVELTLHYSSNRTRIHPPPQHQQAQCSSTFQPLSNSPVRCEDFLDKISQFNKNSGLILIFDKNNGTIAVFIEFPHT